MMMMIRYHLAGLYLSSTYLSTNNMFLVMLIPLDKASNALRSRKVRTS